MSSSTLNPSAGASSRSIGWKFTLSAPILIKSLSWYDVELSLGSGDSTINEAHPIRITDTSGTVYASGTVSPSDPATDSAAPNFRSTMTLTGSLELAAGTYIVTGWASSGQDQYLRGPSLALTFPAAPVGLFTLDSACFCDNLLSSDICTSCDIAGDTARVGPSFTFRSIFVPAYDCTCASGFTGSECETELDEVQKTN